MIEIGHRGVHPDNEQAREEIAAQLEQLAKYIRGGIVPDNLAGMIRKSILPFGARIADLYHERVTAPMLAELRAEKAAAEHEEHKRELRLVLNRRREA